MFTSHEVVKIVAELRGGMAHLFPENSIDTILFGSYARGDAQPRSDIDVLFLVDESRQDISSLNWTAGSLTAELLLSYGIVVSPVVENWDYFNANQRLFPFYRSIDSEGVRISG